MSPWTNKENKTVYLVVPSKVTLPVFDSTGDAEILRRANQAGHKMEADMHSHPHQIVSINLDAGVLGPLGVGSGAWNWPKVLA